jgi:hypothetical protein
MEIKSELQLNNETKQIVGCSIQLLLGGSNLCVAIVKHSYTGKQTSGKDSFSFEQRADNAFLMRFWAE